MQMLVVSFKALPVILSWGQPYSYPVYTACVLLYISSICKFVYSQQLANILRAVKNVNYGNVIAKQECK